MTKKQVELWAPTYNWWQCPSGRSYRILKKWYTTVGNLQPSLVGGVNPYERIISQIGNLPLNRGENKKYLKPPPSSPFLGTISYFCHYPYFLKDFIPSIFIGLGVQFGTWLNHPDFSGCTESIKNLNEQLVHLLHIEVHFKMARVCLWEIYEM